ncbi:MAG TPA: helix-turn-helix domain-containing protein [Candidatus Paceibacterota bacterium]
MVMRYKPISEISRQALLRVGLSDTQAAVYEALIHYGPQKATRLAFLAGIPRTLSYKVLDELVAQGLVVKKNESKAVSVFSPVHPLKLKERLDKQIDEVQEAKTALNKLILDFDAILGTIPEQELYSRVAVYAGKAAFGPLSAKERSTLGEALKNLLKTL